MAAQLYDEILFDNATYADLKRGDGPLIVVMATDISTRLARRVRAAVLRRHLQRPVGGPAVARGGDVVGGAARAVAGHVQQLRRHLRLQVSGLAGRARPIPTIRRGPPRARSSAWRKWRRSRTARTGRSCTWSTAGSPTTSACARCSKCWRSSRRRGCAACKTPLDDVKRIVVVVVNSLSVPKNNWDQSRASARQVRDPAQGDRRADRPLLVRDRRAAARHDRALGR